MTLKKGGGRESGGGVAPRSTPLPSKDAAANPAACPLRIQGEGEAAHDERIRELEARVAELERLLDNYEEASWHRGANVEPREREEG